MFGKLRFKMRLSLSIFVLVLVPLVAGQSEGPPPSDDNPCTDLFIHPSKIEACTRYNKESQDKQDRQLDAWKLANDAKETEKAVEDLEKARSTDTDQQIDGIFGLASDWNSHANKNDLSKEVTDKSLGVIGQMAHEEAAILNSVGTSLHELLGAPLETNSSFDSTSHTLNESIRTTPSPNLEEMFQAQEDKLLASDLAVATVVKAYIADEDADQSVRNSFAKSPQTALSTPQNSYNPAGAVSPQINIDSGTDSDVPEPSRSVSTIPSPPRSVESKTGNLGNSSWTCQGTFADDENDRPKVFGIKLTFTSAGSAEMFLDDGTHLSDGWQQNGINVTWMQANVQNEARINGASMSGQGLWRGNTVWTFTCSRIR
jgi:hypothetical protein